MPQFFIERPVFAWVIAIFIVLAGVLAIPQLPVSRAPNIAPPTVGIYAMHTGAAPQTINDSVLGLIEKELSSVKNLLYFESTADPSGEASITATFKPGTDPEMAQVDIQNRLKTVEARLPGPVRRIGVTLELASSGFIMIVTLSSDNGQYDELALGDYMLRNIVQELKRVEGVGRVQAFGSERAMRIWVDPAKLVSYSLSLSDITGAIQAQNAQITPGRVGSEPAVLGQKVSIPLTVQGQLQKPEEFAAILLRSEPDGSKLVLGDVARVELGAQSLAFAIRENGKPATAAGIQLAPGGNAVRTAAAVQARLDELAHAMPNGMGYAIAFDTTPYVKISIKNVFQTLFEAMILVFLVMLLFLKKIRYTLVPAISAPIALLGTFGVMWVAGFSINVFTMFGMVLAIGIIVDDAIVVVENVERIMVTEGLPPKAATQKAMKEITGAVIGITLVLSAVFVPLGLASGSVGNIYRQFTLSMAVSILFSALLALTLTPVLCATLLKSIDAGRHERRGLLGSFSRTFDRLTNAYIGWATTMVRRTGRMMALYAVICLVLVLAYMRLPSSFVPEEDQGSFITTFVLPADATAERTIKIVSQFDRHIGSRPNLARNLSLIGYGFSGSGPNTATSFTTLKDWRERTGTLDDEIASATAAMVSAPEGVIMSLKPPVIESLGTTAEFSLRVEDRANRGIDALMSAQAQLLQLSAQSKLVRAVHAEGLPNGPSVNLKIDRQKAEALGVSFIVVSDTLTAAIGSTYVNDFPNAGRMQQVIVQADAERRMQVDDVLKLYVSNNTGAMVSLSELVNPVWETRPMQFVRYNGYPAVRIAGRAAPGISSGDAMLEMERLASQLPAGFTVEWTGQSLQEKQSASQAPILLAFSMLVIFLVLAALYESWSIPFSVMLVVPLGMIGSVLAVHLRGLENDVFFKIGLITIIGLSAKNAILIVEFANNLRTQGRGLTEAVLEAARIRLRPILMTSLAFALGVVPLMFARGASAETQRAIGTGVFGGMISATVLAVFFVPVFYVVVMKHFRARKERASIQSRPATPSS
ncbi:multidrug efflux RND transporter permease subunit [Bradyrhizobium sp. BRP22]|uniref:multidrug efflux RND transporter permease subunit n=1 Tax=Bradyrhizobium sp. BRP22 TaxID=2793821 RepID=UPI001CD4A325|nr:multidrug efflux RND transporter permease subunit [Bradyrhizobium sp. BRP22]MCA1458964.1 multidrug efflux RND transporter permease subunit [Bradyrhizobium sp. BRP22]